MWTLEQALEIIKKIEPVLKGYGYGLFLGGSVLVLGKSFKDLDLLIVSRNRTLPNQVDLLKYLSTLGMKKSWFMRFPDREVYVMDLNGKRIDMCFINLHLMKYKVEK